MFAVDALRSGSVCGVMAGCGNSSPAGAGPAPVGSSYAAGASAATVAPAADYGLQAKLAGILQTLQQSLDSGLAGADALLSRLTGDGGGSGAVAFSADALLRQKTTLRFVTQEGDIVELSLRSRAELQVAGAAGAADGGSVAAGSAHVISGARLSIHVHGNLNDAELAAIRDVLGKVEDLAAQFHSGDIAAAFAAASALQIDGAQLASVALDMRQSLRIQAAAATTSASRAPSDPVQATAGAYLATALETLDSAGTAMVQLGLRQKLQLLLQATAGTAAPADPAVVKLAEGVEALS
jgi:hypothetical protein